MSDGLNRVILLGNLGADPELRYTAAGLPVLNLRLATNESFVDRNKEVQQRTEWHTVVIFGARAEGLSRLLTKGLGVLVEGGLRTSSYEKDGARRYKTEVHAREICIASRRAAAGQPDEEVLSRSPLSMEGPPGQAGLPPHTPLMMKDAGMGGGPPPGELETPELDDEPAAARAPIPQRNGKAGASPPGGRIFVDELPF